MTSVALFDIFNIKRRGTSDVLLARLSAVDRRFSFLRHHILLISDFFLRMKLPLHAIRCSVVVLK